MSDLAEKVKRIKPAEKFRFGEWLPDQADLDNPGVTEASNVLWSGGSYLPYNPILPMGVQVLGGTAVAAVKGRASPQNVTFVASTDGVSSNFISGAIDDSFNLINLTGQPLAFSGYWPSFAQYGTTIIYADGVNNPQFNGIGISNTFAKLTGPFGDAPIANTVGVIGQFVLLGGLPGAPSTLRWSGINQPFNWPVPGSADAIAQQAGSQFIDYILGGIVGITYGDQWGLVVCYNGLARLQYVGGDVVFQFDIIYRGPSGLGPQSWIKIGGRVYLCSADGFLMTDGVTVQRIGDARVDRWFLDQWAATNFNIVSGNDPLKKIVYWSFQSVGTGAGNNTWVAYNYVEDKWTHGTDGIACFIKYGNAAEDFPISGTEVFTSAASPQGPGFGGSLVGTPRVGVITTAEIELNPGGRALLQGFRPQIAGLPSGAATVRIGSRARLGDQVAYTPILQLNGQTNFADALVDSSYHRAELTLNGDFDQAIGGEFKAEPSGEW